MVALPSITSHLRNFSDAWSAVALLAALTLIVRQRRTIETLYGLYCNLAYRPSRISPSDDPDRISALLGDRSTFTGPARLTRDHLVRLYGSEFDVASLPRDFRFARYHGICPDGDRLIIGEYGEGSRIACITDRGCVLNSHYGSVTGVRHIHSIVRYGDRGEYLVATGDGAKVLDLRETADGELRFVKRLRKYLAGFTAAVSVNGSYYFGSDFSGRPNFIETLEGVKYFFPPKAYRQFVTAFFVLADRYIASVNRGFERPNGVRTLSLFDTVEKEFVFCDTLTP